MPNRFSKLYTIAQNSRSNSQNMNSEHDHIYTSINTVSDEATANAAAITSHKANGVTDHADLVSDTDFSAHIASGDHDTHTDAMYYRKTDVDNKVNAAANTKTVQAGTAFPAGPYNEGQEFWRSDQKLMYAYSVSTSGFVAVGAPPPNATATTAGIVMLDGTGSAIATSQKGAVNGVATLGADGKVTPSQMAPSNMLTMPGAWIG